MDREIDEEGNLVRPWRTKATSGLNDGLGGWQPFELADESEQKHGWTISTKTLEAIRKKIKESGFDAPSWEGIENVLITMTGLKRNPKAEPEVDDA